MQRLAVLALKGGGPGSGEIQKIGNQTQAAQPVGIVAGAHGGNAHNVRHAELVHGDIAVAAVEKEIDRVTAAKAADELLTLSGIHASVVLYKHGTGVNLSARSLGEINVQFIMEKLGGGGNSTTAGGQVNDATVDEVRERLLAAIDEYMEE